MALTTVIWQALYRPHWVDAGTTGNGAYEVMCHAKEMPGLVGDTVRLAGAPPHIHALHDMHLAAFAPITLDDGTKQIHLTPRVESVLLRHDDQGRLLCHCGIAYLTADNRCLHGDQCLNEVIGDILDQHNQHLQDVAASIVLKLP